MRLLSLLMIGFCLIFTVPLNAKTRLKVGVVFSGGGAKGAAHIGVLNYLEKNNIPVDYIAGTSIGSYVGGLYALGYNADQIEKIMLSLPWDESYSDFIPRELLSFSDKEIRDLYNISFRLGYRDGHIKAPSGLLLGQSTGRLMKLSTDVVAKIDSFDHLAIPFRAVATNLETAQPVVLTKGSLTQVMRASAAVPGIVEPVNIDGQLLVDGGISNNMPVNVVKEMGADIVIAVDIGSSLFTQQEINDTLDVFSQLSTILTINTTHAQKQKLTSDDILIRPNVDKLSTTDFSIMPEALAYGKQAALEHNTTLLKLALSDQEYAHYLTNKKQKSKRWFSLIEQPLITVEYINNSKVNLAIIKEAFALSAGDTVDKQQLKLAIERVYALNKFEHVDAEFIDLKEGRKLILTTQAKSWGPNYLHFGFSLKSDFTNRSIIALDLGYIKDDVTINGGQWRNEIRLGWEYMLASEFYQPLDKNQYYFSKARVEYAQDKMEPTKNRPELTDDYLQAKLALGINYTKNGAIEFGFIGEEGDISPKYQGVENFGYSSVGGYFSFDYDSLNSINFPTQGNKLSFNVFYRNDEYEELTGLDSKDTSLEIKFDWRGAIGFKNHTFVGIASFATVDNDTDFSVHVSELGGFLNLSGYQTDALIGVHKAFSAVVYQYDLGRELFGVSSLPLYLGGSLEAGNVWEVNETVRVDDLISSGSLYLGTDTSFGPAVLGVGFASSGENIVFLSIGKNW